MVLMRRLIDGVAKEERFKEALQEMVNSPSNEFVFAFVEENFSAMLEKGEQRFRITVELIEGEEFVP